MDDMRPPEDPGGKPLMKERNIKVESGSVVYPSLPPMLEPTDRHHFSSADLPISPSTRTPRTLQRTTSASSLKSNATAVLRKKSSMSSVKGTSTPPMSPTIRRQSSNFPSGTSTASPRTLLSTTVEDPPTPTITSEDFAKQAFEKELQAYRDGLVDETELLVVIHDACYGHRFSRPKTTKLALASIVERPERMLAIVKGLSMAYVHLGSRHANGKYPPTPLGEIPPPPFNIRKSTRILPLESSAVTQVHGAEWMKELRQMCEGAGTRLTLDGKELTRIPARDMTGDMKPALHEGDLYLCSESLDAMEGALGGVCDAVDGVFTSSRHRRAFACVRPPGHHCSSDFPSGFCWLNNVHVGIAHAIQNHGLTHAAIIDFDLHHGDGSQEITWAHNTRINQLHKNVGLSKRNPIGYFSIHDINSYPCEYGEEEKVRNASLCIEDAHGQSIWNVHLRPWKTDSDFWRLYETRYLILLEKMRDFLRVHSEKLEAARRATHGKANGRTPEVPKPKAAIFISAGFDASEWEGTGMQRHKVNVPTDFYARFTRDIAVIADEDGLGVEGRIISVLEGGYSDRALASGVLSHICGLTSAAQTRSEFDLAEQMLNLSVKGDDVRNTASTVSGPCETVNPKWWSATCLDEFDDLKPMPLPPSTPAPKKSRNHNPTYITPTQASSAKALPPRRSLPASYKPLVKEPSPPPPPPPPRSPTPPPPPDPVHWAAAANELAKLLIPIDRQTTSCKPEELAAPRQRRQRQSDIGFIRPESAASTASTVTVESKRTGLRERKTKPIYTSDNDDEKAKKAGSRAPSRANRRRTMGGPKASPKKEQAPLLMTDAPPLPPLTILPVGSSSRPVSPFRAQDGAHSAGPVLMAPPIQRVLSDSQVPQQQMPPPPVPAGVANMATASDGEIENRDTQTFDVLTSGMKKMSIKLNVPTKEEHDRRERSKEFQRLQSHFQS